MKKDYAVEFNGVYKKYRLKNKNVADKDNNKDFYALKDINFKVEKGDSVGILGTNGSGKSTLSVILAGISSVDKGTVKINGEQALIAINTGLKNQLTGLENIKAKGALLGLSKKRIEEITDGVVKFAELGDFLYQPVKKYSSGMKARLGFSISIYLNPDIIIIDEALSVGDSAFSDKCVNKINEFKEAGKTIFFVSHSLAQVKSFCNKGMWIEAGSLIEYGDINEVSQKYSEFVEDYKKKSEAEKNIYREEVFRKRLVKEEKKVAKFKPRVKKKKKVYMLSVLLIVTVLISCVYGSIRVKNRNIAQILSEDYNYTFLIEGDPVEKYLDEYRVYLKDNKEATLGSIVNINIKKTGQIIISKIPNQLEIYYENLKKSDEIRFIESIKSEKMNVKEEVSRILNKEVNSVFLIKRHNLKAALKEINSTVEFTDSESIYTINSNVIKIENDSYGDEEKIDIIKLNELISQELRNEEKKLVEKFLGLILEGNEKSTSLEVSSVFLAILDTRVYENISIEYSNLKFNEKKISDLVGAERAFKVSKNELLEKKIFFIDDKYIKQNVYYDALNKEIIKEETKSTTESEDKVDEVKEYIQPTINLEDEYYEPPVYQPNPPIIPEKPVVPNPPVNPKPEEPVIPEVENPKPEEPQIPKPEEPQIPKPEEPVIPKPEEPATPEVDFPVIPELEPPVIPENEVLENTEVGS